MCAKDSGGGEAVLLDNRVNPTWPQEGHRDDHDAQSHRMPVCAHQEQCGGYGAHDTESDRDNHYQTDTSVTAIGCPEST